MQGGSKSSLLEFILGFKVRNRKRDDLMAAGCKASSRYQSRVPPNPGDDDQSVQL